MPESTWYSYIKHNYKKHKLLKKQRVVEVNALFDTYRTWSLLDPHTGGHQHHRQFIIRCQACRIWCTYMNVAVGCNKPYNTRAERWLQNTSGVVLCLWAYVRNCFIIYLAKRVFDMVSQTLESANLLADLISVANILLGCMLFVWHGCTRHPIASSSSQVVTDD